jgi:hypothetical protein
LTIGHNITILVHTCIDAKRRRRLSLVMHKKRRKMLPFVSTKERVPRLTEMLSTTTALTS